MNTIAVTPTTTAGLDIGLALKQGWRLFVKDLGPLLIASLVAALLTVVTLGILAGPLFAGLVGMAIGRVRDDRPARVGDVFAGMERFWSYFAAALVLGLLIGLASITIIGGLLLTTIWLYVFPLMVDRGMTFGAALTASKDMVVRAGFWEHLAFVIVVVVAASLLDGIPALLATPLLIAAGVAAYFLADGRGEALERI